VRADTDDRGTVLKITRIVDDNAQNFHARPSPDGSHIAFDSDREGVRAVFVADSDGQHVQRVSGDGFAAVPSWSPDGQRLAFVKAEPDKPRVWNIWLANRDGGDLRRITGYPYGQPWGGSWFPDGQRIAYSHEDELIVLNLATNGQQTYKTPRSGHLVRTPAVSPDGRRVIFQVQRDGAWLLDLRNGSMRRVLDDPSAEEYTWSPDGHRVAFHSHRAGGWGVWVMGQ
jgi:TolB protein